MLTGTDSQLIHGSRPPLELPARDARLGLAHRLRDAFQNLASSAAMIALAAGLADCSKSGRMVLSIAQEGNIAADSTGIGEHVTHDGHNRAETSEEVDALMASKDFRGHQTSSTRRIAG